MVELLPHRVSGINNLDFHEGEVVDISRQGAILSARKIITNMICFFMLCDFVRQSLTFQFRGCFSIFLAKCVVVDFQCKIKGEGKNHFAN